MRKYRLRKAILFYFFCVLNILFSNLYAKNTTNSDQHTNYKIKNFSVSEGLSDCTVQSIFQDKFGLIWIGTNDGLNCFNSYNFKTYRYQMRDTNSLSCNAIKHIVEDKNGNLWIATQYGLNRYNRIADNFTRFLVNHNNSYSSAGISINRIAFDSDNNLWLATLQDGLFCLNPSTNKLIQYNTVAETKKISSNNLRTVYIDNEGIVWIGTQDKGIDYLLPGGSLKHIEVLESNSVILSNDVRSIIQDRKGNIWFGTHGGGLTKYNKTTGGFTIFTKDGGERLALTSNIIFNILEDSNEKIWICTEDGGINIYEPQNDNIAFLNFNPKVNHGISSNIVFTVFQDSNNNYWIGHYKEGVDFIDSHAKKFRSITYNPYDPKSISGNHILSILLDADNNLWIGTDGNGLNVYNDQIKGFVKVGYSKSFPYPLSSEKPVALKDDKQGNIWVGLYNGGLNKINRFTGKVTYYPFNDSSDGIRGKNIWDLMIDDNKLWIGTGNGLELYHLDKNYFTHFPVSELENKGTNSEYIWCIEKLTSGELILGTSNGINVYNPETEKFSYIRHDLNDTASLSDNWITNIHQDKKGRIWIGTHGGGLNLWNRSENQFVHFGTKKGLPDYTVNQIAEWNNNIWLSTNRGLSRLDLNKMKFKHYSSSDYLLGNQFSFYAGFTSKDGTIYFGGTNGITYFQPDEILDNQYTPPIIFTDFKLFNKPVSISHKDSPLKENIILADQIDVNFRSVFTIYFAALNYSYPECNQYKYKMVGFEDKWNNAGNKNSATYTNLDPGKYTFKVIGSNNDEKWNNKGHQIKIVVHPPFYGTIWFKTLVFIILISAYLYISTTRVRKIKQRKMQLEQIVKERTNELNLRNQELKKQHDLANKQKDQILQQNAELEQHRNKLEELITKRTNELKIAKEQAEESDRLKTAFLENMSHEIRTPMNAILGFVNLINNPSLDHNSRDYYFNYINQSGKTLLRLIDDIIDFSKIETGQLVIEKKECQLERMISELITEYRDRTIREKPTITIAVNHPDQSLDVIADCDKVKQTLSYLIDNAIKFTPSGSVTISYEPIENEIEFKVEDTGIGINENNIKRVFDRFYKVEEDKTKVFRGAGLGLAISKRLVELMGGKIWAKSVHGKGSVFYFTIPHQVHDAQKKEVKTTKKETYDWRNFTILIAEDDDTNYYFLEAVLYKTKVTIIRAVDGVELLEIFNNDTHFDLLLLDIKMPGLNGFNAIRLIRQQNKDLPVIAQTAFTQSSDREKCLQYGCNDYMAKPINKDLLLKKIAAFFEK